MDEEAFRNLISGQKRGLSPTLGRGLLKAASYCYGWGIRARNAGYNLGWIPAHTAPAPVISVGNLTTGGTGKTPFVAWLARWFHDREIPIALLSRGYRSLPGHANDEKLLLDRLCPGVPHLQNPNRLASAEIACREFGSRVLILDDGFQHRRLARTLNIVLIDALNPWGYGHLLPRGLLREPISSLHRADFVVLTRADQCTDHQRRDIATAVHKYHSDSQYGEIAFRPQRFINANGQSAPLASLAGQRVVAFCGIGNPEAFTRTLTAAGLNVAAARHFPDHHHFCDADLIEIQNLTERCAATAIVMTCKDLVKINQEKLDGHPLWALEIGTEILRGRAALQQRLEQVLQQLRDG